MRGLASGDYKTPIVVQNGATTYPDTDVTIGETYSTPFARTMIRKTRAMKSRLRDGLGTCNRSPVTGTVYGPVDLQY